MSFTDLKNTLTQNTDVETTDTTVFRTKNYTKFKFSPLNRKPTHYEKIRDSIAKRDLTKYNPILVAFTDEGDLLIIEGQNRFLACKELGIFIYFIVSDEADIEDAPALNNASKNWSNTDYVKHYATKGDGNYMHILELHAEYSISITSLIRICSGQHNVGIHIKEGTYKIREDYNFIEFCEHWCEFHDYIPFANKTFFIDALASCYFHKNFDPERMISKLHQCSGMLHDQNTREHFRQEIQKLYNYKMGKENLVSILKY